ncbi:MAG: PSD1 and planctomycete cytochrome C domain-containing protein [Chthoniobacteraceae bacterium]
MINLPRGIFWRLPHRVVAVTAAACLATPAGGAAPDFEKDIRPLLTERCIKCHGPEKQKGGLRLDSKAAAFKGGESDDPGIVPGHASQSRLFQLASSKKEDERMPPKGEPLDAQQLGLLQRWIDAGAEWPEPGGAVAKIVRSEMKVTDADRQHWSFLPWKKVTPPTVSETAWVRTPVDLFIRHAQEEKGIAPAAPAVARTLVRRIYFDLVGLPPTPEEMGRWTSRIDKSRDMVATLVDELLTSPHYGERWGRHWLDVARYADSDGMESDQDRPTAFHFRDFVIGALNDDMPYDQFVRWQLAGDELAPNNAQAIAATGFITAGVSSTLPDKQMEEEKLRNRANELDDMVSTTGQAMLGLTIACARCHDHKYDPLPTRDYYRMLRIFNSGDRREVPLASLAEVKANRAATDAWQAENDAAAKTRDEWLKEARTPFEEQVRVEKIAKLSVSDDEKRLLRERPDDGAAKNLARRFKKDLKIENADYVPLLPARQKARWDELDAHVKAVAKRQPAALPTAFAFADFAREPRESWFFERGNFLARNEKMDLGFFTVLTNGKAPEDYWKAARDAKLRDDSTQQRRALAEWMTDLDHGAGVLLARVMVNRVWQHHFGEGLVRTVSDFGTRGEPPTHPELLEWLTGEFIRSGWSVKHLHRLIVNSATYQQGSASNKKATEIDPENRLLWHRRPLRLESEILRDSMLSVAGNLNPAMFGPSFKPPIPAEAMQARNVKDPYPKDAQDTPETRRRTIYMFHKRVVQYPLMQAFDAPDAQQSCGRRMNTTVAPQALALLNDPFVRSRAGELAQRVEADAGGDARSQVRRLFQLCLSREPAPGELADACAFLAAQTAIRTQRDGKQSAAAAQLLALTDFCQSLFGLNEFIYVD